MKTKVDQKEKKRNLCPCNEKKYETGTERNECKMENKMKIISTI